jgi:hypothetical protein
VVARAVVNAIDADVEKVGFAGELVIHTVGSSARRARGPDDCAEAVGTAAAIRRTAAAARRCGFIPDPIGSRRSVH